MNSISKKVIIVLAGSRREYLNYLENEGKHSIFRYVEGNTVVNMDNVEAENVVRIGTWYKRPNAKDLEAFALSRVRK